MLSRGLDIARSALSTSGELSSIVSRNVANAGNALASRKIAHLVSVPGGGVAISAVTRLSSEALTRGLQTSISTASSNTAIANALETIEQTVNDPESGASIAAIAADFRNSIEIFSQSPNSPSLAAQAVEKAKQLAAFINDASSTVATARLDADRELQNSVSEINRLLRDFKTLNDEIIRGTHAGADITDQLDARDELVRSLAEHVGVRSVSGPINDMKLYTDSGLTLFDSVPRQVSMQAATALLPGTPGNSVLVDGVAISGTGAMMAVETGRIAGLAAVRDTHAITYQNQLDELARGLVEMFAEHDQSASPSLAPIPGLFTFAGATGVPVPGTVVPGLAGALIVNPNADPSAGGNPLLLRDGSIGDPGNPSFTYNTSGAAGYTDRLRGLIAEFSVQRPFDASSDLSANTSFLAAAADSAGWLETERQKAHVESEYRSTVVQRARDALTRASGVNLDEEMTSLLEIERSYQSTSRLIGVLDGMFQSLLQAV